MPCACIPRVERTGVKPCKVLHSSIQISLWKQQHQVKMRVEKAVRPAGPSTFRERDTEQEMEGLEVRRVALDRAAVDAPHRDVVRRAGNLDTERSRHLSNTVPSRRATALGA